MQTSSIPEVVNDIHNGHLVIVVDDENRENEGDLVCASSLVTPEQINFMVTYGRGLICMTMTAEHCKRLDLPLMVEGNDVRKATNFTLSIDAKEGITTGISAYDRAKTIRVAVDDHSQPSDLVRPGHMFPLMGQDGGVLVRAGHTEAGCDLTRLAGLTSSAVIVEILNDDGTMARLPDLEVFADKHSLKICRIKELAEYLRDNQ